VGARASVHARRECTSSRRSRSTRWIITSRRPGTSGRNASCTSVSAPAGSSRRSGATWSEGCHSRGVSDGLHGPYWLSSKEAEEEEEEEQEQEQEEQQEEVEEEEEEVEGMQQEEEVGGG
jgi:TATA-binding protein-associated factor Taf7